jgi:hypothetical protein
MPRPLSPSTLASGVTEQHVRRLERSQAVESEGLNIQQSCKDMPSLTDRQLHATSPISRRISSNLVPEPSVLAYHVVSLLGPL